MRPAPSLASEAWGEAAGRPVDLYTLESGSGMTVTLTNYGGVIQSIWVPGTGGEVANVALGFATLADYVSDFEGQPWPAAGGSGDTHFGAIVGRCANRIAGATFTLDGRKFSLPANNGPNTLHGGSPGWNTKVWSAAPESGAGFAAVRMSYTDPDGANGFPGELATTVLYKVTPDNALRIRYRATTTKPTVVNLTNHTYFNLAGEGSGHVHDQLLRVNAERFTPVNANLIPTGEFAPVEGTPFDFRQAKPIGRDIRRADLAHGEQLALAHGYDHNFVIGGRGLRLAADALDRQSGRVLRVYTTEPGLQVYTGNFLVGDLTGTGGRTYRQGDAFALETQHYPDSPNRIGHDGWPSVVLRPGQVFDSTTIFQFAVV